MNIDQILSLIRWFLSVGGPVTAILLSRGMTHEQIDALQTAVLAIVGSLPPLISVVWSMFSHTENAKLKSVEAMPEVKNITIEMPSKMETITTAQTAGISAAIDPERPKVVAA
jgi:hypothetical protein